MGRYLEIAKQTRADTLIHKVSPPPAGATVRFTIRETEDVGGDVALMRKLAAIISEYPGANRIIGTIITLDENRIPMEWTALACSQLRQRISDIVKERSLSLDSVCGEVVRVK